MDSYAEKLQAAVNKQIRMELAERDLSQQDFSAALGLNPGSMSRYMQGQRSIPLRTLFGAAEFFGMTATELLARAEGRAFPSRAADRTAC